LAKNTNKFDVRYEYATQPIQLPVIKAHGVGLRSPNEPRATATRSDAQGARNDILARNVPISGHKISTTNVEELVDEVAIGCCNAYLLLSGGDSKIEDEDYGFLP